MVIDWKRSWRNLLTLKDEYPELKDVQVFTIGRDVLPFFWNPFRGPPNSDRDSWISTIADSLEKSHLSGQGVAYHIIRTYRKLFRGLSSDFYPNFFDGLIEINNIRATFRELQWKQTAQRIFQSFTTGEGKQSQKDKKKIKTLERELLRKEKALAETAALLVLRKKSNAIWGEKEDE